MLITTEAIVLNHIAYSDNKRIITLFSRQEGLMSAMLRSGNPKSTKVSLLEPFSTVEIIAKRSNGSLVYINDISPLKIYKTIPFDAEKRLTTLFMAEVVYRTIREQYRDTSLYDFLDRTISLLDFICGNTLEFSLIFLLEYGRRLGIYPNTETYYEGAIFDMQNGIFCRQTTHHEHFATEENSRILAQFLKEKTDSYDIGQYTRTQMIEILDIVVRFFELHLPNFKYIKSLEIIRQVF